MTATEDAPARRRPPGPAFVAGLAALYAGVLAAATFPYVLSIDSAVPCGGDPPQHLWIMRWYKSCLIEGRSPLFCPSIQHPVGAPIGNFSPLHAPSLVFVPLSLALGDGHDALCYNLAWTVGMLLTGLGTFALGWRLVGDRAAAGLAGLLAMLSGPVMLHAHAHLELTYVGSFPLFLVAWMGLVDRPTRRNLTVAAAAFVFMTACAAYFAVLASIPAAFYAAWSAARAGRSGIRAWAGGRWAAGLGFGAIVLPCLAALFVGQLSAVARGYSMARSLDEFADHGAAWWGYVAPTSYHALFRLLPSDPWAASGYRGVRFGLIVDNASYLGVVTLGLVAVAAVGRARFAKSAFAWSCLGLLVALSLGAYLRVGGRSIPMPSLWLWKVAAPFRMLRSPARFNMLAAVVAAVIAGAGWRRLTDRWRAAPRLALLVALGLVAVADLGMMPYDLWPVTPPPPAYAAISARSATASVLELPLQSSSFDQTHLDRTYWQSRHRLRTSSGASGINNPRYDFLVCWNSPFAVGNPDYLADPSIGRAGPVSGASAGDVAWLYLKDRKYDYLLIHRGDSPELGLPAPRARLESILAPARVFEDAATAAYESARLPTPTRPVAVLADGWRWSPTGPVVGASGRATLAAYNPDPDADLALWLAVAAVREPRTVRILAGGREVARWRVEPGPIRLYGVPRFRMPAGLQSIEFASDAQARPHAGPEALDEARTPYSLRVAAVDLKAAEPAVAAGGGAARK